MTELSDLMAHMARGGYRLHKELGPMQDTPEPSSASERPPEASEQLPVAGLIEQLVEGMTYDVLFAWADQLGVTYNKHYWIDNKDFWLDDDWPENEDELRVAVVDAMERVGKERGGK